MSWETIDGSIGKFTIASSFCENETPQPFYLCHPVVAGEVYGIGLLLRTPPYHFLWVTNGKDLSVFRFYPNGKTIEDNISKTSIVDVSLALDNIFYKKITVSDFFFMKDFFLHRIVCRLDYGDYVSEFPVRHINLKRDRKLFQVETGPVITKINEKIMPAFIFINSTNHVQIVPQYPLLDRKVSIQETNVEFFINA